MIWPVEKVESLARTAVRSALLMASSKPPQSSLESSALQGFLSLSGYRVILVIQGRPLVLRILTALKILVLKLVHSYRVLDVGSCTFCLPLTSFTSLAPNALAQPPERTQAAEGTKPLAVWRSVAAVCWQHLR